MPDLPGLLVFFVAATVLLVTPGPAVLYIVARSIDQGRTAGVVSVLGIAAGTFFHVAAATFGLSAILVSSALAFSIVKYLGAGYLIYLGVRKFFVADPVEDPAGHVEPRRLRRIFYEGVLVNVLNPKTALFFFAFLPQFVDVSKGAVAPQILLLGFLFVVMGLMSDGAYALLAGSIGDWLKRNFRLLKAQRYFAGSVFIALGVVTALHGSGKK
jgi:threonine/homoserine/homoserine lactone efflux protein